MRAGHDDDVRRAGLGHHLGFEVAAVHRLQVGDDRRRRGSARASARTPCIPSAMISGVPASSQSTPARMAISAVDRASSMLVRSSEIWTMGFTPGMIRSASPPRQRRRFNGDSPRRVFSGEPYEHQKPDGRIRRGAPRDERTSILRVRTAKARRRPPPRSAASGRRRRRATRTRPGMSRPRNCPTARCRPPTPTGTSSSARRTSRPPEMTAQDGVPQGHGPRPRR